MHKPVKKNNNTENITEQTIVKRRRIDPLDDTGYTEISVAVLGSVDSGKSTLIGTIVGDTLDDGNGLSRRIVFVHPHERETGRTSDVSYQYMKDEHSKRIITFVDLAGHEAYLKTTVSGLMSNHPDIAFVCISDKITKMTKEHMGLCVATGIPFVVLFTKIDFLPQEITAGLINNVKRILMNLGKKFYNITKAGDIDLCLAHKDNIIPYIKISNKTGIGLDMIRLLYQKYPKRERKYINGFAVEHIYTVQGRGTVVSGFTGIDITKGDSLFLGPFSSGNFIQVRVKSIHNDYRFDIDTLSSFKRGCLCIDVSSKDKSQMHKGMILSKTLPNNVCKKFTAKVKILHHHTTIRVGYQAYANCGMIKEPVRFNQILSLDGNILDTIRSGDEVNIQMEFLNRYNYVEKNQVLVFREGTTRAVGYIISAEN